MNLLSMKSNFMHLIRQADLQINGKTIESTQPFINVAQHFQMSSEMSVNDLQTIISKLPREVIRSNGFITTYYFPE